MARAAGVDCIDRKPTGFVGCLGEDCSTSGGGCVHKFVWLAILQADEDVLVVFHDLAEGFEAIVKPDLFGDLPSLNLCKHFFIFSSVHCDGC